MDGWASCSKVDVANKFVAKSKGCAKTLAKWNTNTFGHVGKEIKSLENMLKVQKDVSRCEILCVIRELQKKEEILWW